MNRLLHAMRAGVVSLLVAACVSPGSTGPIATPQPPASETTSPVGQSPVPSLSVDPEAAPSCFNDPVHQIMVPPSLAVFASDVPRILVATFQGFEGQAQYATLDGSRVKKKDFESQSLLIYRRIGLHPEQTIRGPLGEGELKMALPGGTVGCDTQTFDNGLTLTKGKQYLIFVGKDNPSPHGNPPLLNAAWPVENGAVLTPQDGNLSLDRVREIVAQNPCTNLVQCPGQ